jgi:hypothetical protein
MKRRHFLKQGLLVGAATVMPGASAHAQTVPDGHVSVRNYGARGDGVTDDSAAIQRAMDGNKAVWFPAGVYLVGNLKLRNGQRLAGVGVDSKLRQRPGAMYAVSANPGTEGSSDPRLNLTGIRISRLRFEGQAKSGGVDFNEHVHLLNLHGVTDLEISDCQFVKAVGDGIYLGSSNALGVERHNLDVRVLNCIFDGFVKNNRNCITVIDGTNVTIDGCQFTRWGRPDMPSAIDIEPNPGANNAFTRIENVVISRCTIWDMASSALISIVLPPNDALRYPVKNLQVLNCRGVGVAQEGQQGLLVSQWAGNSPSAPTATTPALGLLVDGCSFERLYRPFSISNAKGVTVRGTNFAGGSVNAMIGDGAGVLRSMALRFEDVDFKQIGIAAMKVCHVDDLTFDRCTFEDCGSVGGVVGEAALIFSGTCTSSSVRLLGTRISSPLGYTRRGILVNPNHRLTPATNQQVGTVMTDGVSGNNFLPTSS